MDGIEQEGIDGMQVEDSNKRKIPMSKKAMKLAKLTNEPNFKPEEVWKKYQSNRDEDLNQCFKRVQKFVRFPYSVPQYNVLYNKYCKDRKTDIKNGGQGSAKVTEEEYNKTGFLRHLENYYFECIQDLSKKHKSKLSLAKQLSNEPQPNFITNRDKYHYENQSNVGTIFNTNILVSRVLSSINILVTNEENAEQLKGDLQRDCADFFSMSEEWDNTEVNEILKDEKSFSCLTNILKNLDIIILDESLNKEIKDLVQTTIVDLNEMFTLFELSKY